MARRASGWRPTRVGDRVARAAEVMEGEVKALLADLAGKHGSPRTTVSITAPHWFCRRLLLPAVPSLIEEAPWLDLAIAASSRVMNLAQREADVAVRNRRPAEGNFVVRRAGELGSALYASARYVDRHGPIDASRATGHALVGFHDRVSYVPAFEWLEHAATDASSVMRADDSEAIFEAVRAGVGAGVVPCLIGDSDRALRRMSPIHHETIWLVSPIELAGTRAVKMTLSFLAEVFRRNARQLAGAP
jgi:DNA-binding transcriptional LysR family regulator